ncbi:sugar phosphate nucleotidyltransferase [Chloroflexota bacterium]
MKAVILVGGEATRLLPLTCNTPKAMVSVLNIPFLEHVIRHLSSHQVKDIVLAQSRLSQLIESYFGDGNQLGVRLHYTVEDTPMGTAGAVKNAERYLDETFLVLNGDLFTDLDITAMIEFHRERRAKATISLTAVDDPTSYGLIETEAPGRVTRFLEKPDWGQVTTNMINAGTYVLEPDVLARIPSQMKVSIERETFPQLINEDEPVFAYPPSGYWIDIGTPQKYLQLHRDLLCGRSRQYALTSGEKVLIGEQSYIHPTARIMGPVVIGSDCSIGQGVKLTGPVVIGNSCTIMEGAVIEESVIWQQVQLGQGVSLKNSIVANHCCLNAGSIIEDSLLSDNVTVASGCKLEPGSKIWPWTTMG